MNDQLSRQIETFPSNSNRQPQPKGSTDGVRLRHLARRFHDLGPQPPFYLLREIGAGADLMACLEEYARLDPGLVKALGADVLPAPRAIPGGRR